MQEFGKQFALRQLLMPSTTYINSINTNISLATCAALPVTAVHIVALFRPQDIHSCCAQQPQQQNQHIQYMVHHCTYMWHQPFLQRRTRATSSSPISRTAV
jgi:hypothetical protein